MTKAPKIIISGGGTGGHIFPAISIANAIKTLVPDACILFVGAEGRMEMEKVPAAGYNIKGLPVSGLKRSLTLSNIKVIFKYLKSIRLAKKILEEFKPDAAVGVGGYASAPLLKAAQSKKIPYIIQEQNSYAGITNRMLSKRASKICVAYQGMEKFFPEEKIIITGNPVRKSIVEAGNSQKAKAKEWFGFKATQKCILVTGGSLGSATLNNCVQDWILKHSDSDTGIIWQCGKYSYNRVKDFNRDNPREYIRYFEFITDMDKAFAASDVVISRAGAGTISELALAGKAVIFVPSPNVAEDHQTHNAMSLVKNDAALIVKDGDAPKTLFATAEQLLNNSERINELESNIGKMAKKDSDIKIAEQVISLFNK